jgi:hypothetical protein
MEAIYRSYLIEISLFLYHYAAKAKGLSWRRNIGQKQGLFAPSVLPYAAVALFGGYLP